MEELFVQLFQMFVSIGGLAVAVKIAVTLTQIRTQLDNVIEDLLDHEHRIRKLEGLR